MRNIWRIIKRSWWVILSVLTLASMWLIFTLTRNNESESIKLSESLLDLSKSEIDRLSTDPKIEHERSKTKINIQKDKVDNMMKEENSSKKRKRLSEWASENL